MYIQAFGSSVQGIMTSKYAEQNQPLPMIPPWPCLYQRHVILKYDNQTCYNANDPTDTAPDL